MVFVIVYAGLMSLAGTMIGAVLGSVIKNPSKKVLSTIFFLSSFFMLFVIVFDLLPECYNNFGLFYTLIFNLIVVLVMYIVDNLLLKNDKDEMMKLAFVTSLGLMIHNFPEGMIIGAGLMANRDFGIKISIMIMLHDIPEGLSVAAPLVYKGMKFSKIIMYSVLTSIPTVFGAILGVYFGNINKESIVYSLTLASGIMIYICFFNLIPRAISLVYCHRQYNTSK